MRLVPEAPGRSPAYWCTWYLQNRLAEPSDASNAFGFTGHSAIAATLTADNLKTYAYERDFLRDVRGDLLVVYDLGWDVPADAAFDGAQWELGSQLVAEDKFPFCTGEPAERLRKLDEWTKSYGWRGTGLWVPAHAFGDGKGGRRFDMKETAAFFRERLRWSAEAGIAYWKVDYGRHCGSAAFRRMLTELGREIAPGLLIEHARNGGPFNDEECPWDTQDLKHTGRFAEWDGGSILRHSAEVAAFSDVFRTYDVSRSLSVPTTLDRVVHTLAALRASGMDPDVILNCESEPYIGAVMGCAVGIMEYDTPGHYPLLDAFRRALAWQRMAPPWRAGAGEIGLSAEYLADAWDFRPGSDWVDYLKGRTVGQAAPAAASRGIPLPSVGGPADDPAGRPYVIASRHPNGAVAAAALPRRSVERGAWQPLADVEVQAGDGRAPIGLFGRFGSVRLRLDGPAPVSRVWAQDLLGGAAAGAADVTGDVHVGDRHVEVPGGLLDRLCGGAFYPGIVLRLSAE